MASHLRVLILEDNETDADVLLHELLRAGLEFEAQRVDNEPAYLQALTTPIDLILADYQMPAFDALTALAHLQARKLEIPFIIVTGTLTDHLALECIRQGAADFLLKDRLGRLGMAIRQALEQKQLRDAKSRLEEQFRQAQKMEAVGRLAGGVAHDFNNVLTVIQGYIDLVLGSPDLPSAFHYDLQQMGIAAKRAATLTRQLLAFSRQQVLQPRVISINELVTSVSKMLRRLIGEDVKLEFRLTQTPLWIKADPGQFEQVIMNLVINSRDAMPNGGVLTIGTDPVSREHLPTTVPAPAHPGPYVRLSVSDTGCGMDAETRVHMFEPFFTTKEPGKGTGLGLSTVYGIVTQSGGSIGVTSEPGIGTTVTLYLPRAAEEYQRAESIPATMQRGGTETILLLEDEEMVRSLARRILKDQGYSVLEAGNGDEAIQTAGQYSGTIHLLLTDVVLPGDSGLTVATRLHDVRPDMRVLYVSGYTKDMNSLERILEAGAPFLSKPFTPDMLTRKVRETLDGGHGGVRN